MNHSDHVRLLKGGIPNAGGIWADLGSGTGAFTLALAELIGQTGEIYSIDKDQGALRVQEHTMRTRFPLNQVHYIQADFTQPIDLPPLDGIVMANSLHFQKPDAKERVLKRILDYLCPGGRLIVIEYNTDQGNMWVPYPTTFATFEKIAARSGFISTRLLATIPSRFLGQIFSAASEKLQAIS